MDSLNQALYFVNGQADYQLARSNHFRQQGDQVRADAYHKRHLEFLSLKQFLESHVKEKPASNSLHLTPNDLIGLPEELIKELNISDSDKQDFFLMEVIEDLGGIASIDKIMIQAYRKNGEILERQKLSAKLYRMVSKDLIHSLPSKKGVYSLQPITEEEEQNMED